MDGKSYITTQMRLIEIGRIADTLDIEGFLKCIENAEKFLPAVNGDAFIKASANFAAVKHLANSVLPVKVAYEQTFKSVMNANTAAFVRKANLK